MPTLIRQLRRTRSAIAVVFFFRGVEYGKHVATCSTWFCIDKSLHKYPSLPTRAAPEAKITDEQPAVRTSQP